MKNWPSAVIVGVILLISINHANALETNFISINRGVNGLGAINRADGVGSNLLTNFRQLVEAVDNGFDVRAIVHFNKCFILGSEKEIQKLEKFNRATTRFNFNQYFYAQLDVDDRVINTMTTSMNVFILGFSGESALLAGRLSVFENNTAKVHLTLLDTVLKKQQLAGDWQCEISNGQDNNGLVLFYFS